MTPDTTPQPTEASQEPLDGMERLPHPTRSKRTGGAIAGKAANAKGGFPTLACDGTAAAVARGARDATILRLSRDGWSLRAIAHKLGCSAPTVNDALKRALAERMSTNAMEAKALRQLVGDRLDDTRKRLLVIARDLDNDVNDRISAERALVLVEAQRAKTLGLNKVETDEGWQAFAHALVNRSRPDAADVLDAELIEPPSALPSPADASRPAQAIHTLPPALQAIADEEAKAPHTPAVKQAIGTHGLHPLGWRGAK
jgi:lambda repressor-like predicted transcriptional regulator